MIVTHTVNTNGQRRVYLGGKSSVECWVEPTDSNIDWTFHIETSPTGFPLPNDQLRAWAMHTLLMLAETLAVNPADLKSVPFECIAALHSSNPAEYRRIAVPRKQSVEHGFMSTMPNINRPQTDFTSRKFRGERRT